MTKLFPSRIKTSRKIPSGSDLLTKIVEFLDDRKAEDIVTINLKGKTNLFDYMVVASGTSQRHLNAIADNLTQVLKTDYGIVATVEGLHQSDWVLVDAGDVIVHMFRPEVRAFYNLERMWDARLDAATSSGAGNTV